MGKAVRTKEVVRVASYRPGRVRLRFAPERSASPDFAPMWKIPAVREVTYRKLTGSLVVYYDETLCDTPDLLAQVQAAYPTVEIAGAPRDAYERELPHNLLSSIMYYYSDATNRAAHEKTGGAADLTSVLPMLFFAWATIDLIVRPAWPKWFELYREGSYLWHFYQNSYARE